MNIVRADKPGVKFPYYGSPLQDIDAIDILIEQGVKNVTIKVDPEDERILEILRDIEEKEAEKKVVKAEPKTVEKRAETVNDSDFGGIDLEDALKKADEVADGKEFELTEEEQKRLNDLNEIKDIHARANEELRTLLHKMKIGYSLDLTLIRGIVGEFVLYGLNKPDVLMTSTRLKYEEDYLNTHCINVCVLSILVGIEMKMSPRDVNLLGLAGILHDIGMTKISDAIVYKQSRLTDREYETIKKHPEFAVSMLGIDKTIKPEVIRAIQQHHERLDGSGYPSGFKGAEISKFALILGLADSYDAMTSEKKYKTSITKYEALKDIYSNVGSMFHPVVVKAFVELVGALPVETVVRLSNGEIAVVIELNGGFPNQPKVLIVRNAEGFKTIPKTFCLFEDNKDGLFVKEVLDPKKIDIDPSEIFNSYLHVNKSN